MSNSEVEEFVRLFDKGGINLKALGDLKESAIEIFSAALNIKISKAQIQVLIEYAKNSATAQTRVTSASSISSDIDVSREENKRRKAFRPILEANSRSDEIQRKVKISEKIRDITYTLCSAIHKIRRRVSQLKSGPNLEICFCIDATGSMSGYIKSVKECITKVSNNISESTGMTCRLSLVVYRDYCDGPLRHQIWDFCNSSELAAHLETVRASGGGDGPEDCFGGLWASATRVSWSAPAKVIVWMGDSPQHGRQYAGDTIDSFPNGDPDGCTADKIFTELQRKHIDLVFCKLNENTNAMCAQLHEDAKPFGKDSFMELDYEGEMSSFLTSSIESIVSSTASSGAYSLRSQEKSFSLTPATWNLDEKWGPEEIAEVLTFCPYIEEFHPLLELLFDGANIKTRFVSVRITRNPVESGRMRLASYAKIIEKQYRSFFKIQKKGVVKESRYEGKANSNKYLCNQAHIQAVAILLAKEFSLVLAKMEIEMKLIYVPVEIIRISSRPLGKDYFSLEPFISGEYVRFNNNNGEINKKLVDIHPIIQTFSHFTYCYSRGLVIVTDLQGVVKENSVYMLTDPAIHTLGKKYLKDPTNLGNSGISAFFGTHVCNSFCQALGLEMPNLINVTAPFESFGLDPIIEEDIYEDFDF